MQQALSTLALLLVAVTMGLSLAHALEFPGKLRLGEGDYKVVQAIYYPGFTLGGLIGELGGILVLAALLRLTPSGSDRFWLTLAALVLMLACHATYWVVTHPVNSAWLAETKLGVASQFFFGLFSSSASDWRHMRNVWEWSHVARSCLALLAFLSMALAVAR